MLIKICGIKDLKIAEFAVQQGANYIGLVFHPASKRNVTIAQAKQIADTTRNTGGTPVAVVVDQTAAEIETICQETGITVVQLHGTRAKQNEYLLPETLQRIFVCSVNNDGTIKDSESKGIENLNSSRDFLLFDGLQAGSGQPFNWENFTYHHQYHHKFRWFLSGGLSPDNIRQALTQLNPTGVDVSSGVEDIQGSKDIKLIKKFIENVKNIK
jgi:phosphoribosylanthranilate isomerase